MLAHLEQNSRVPAGLRMASIVALIFGVVTMISAGSVLFGPDGARDMAGNFVTFVVWFNFGAGILYVIAAAGIGRQQDWAAELSLGIALATGIAALAFASYIISGPAFEWRTVSALVLRAGFWAGIFVFIRRKLA